MVENHAHLTPEKQLLKLIEEPHSGRGRTGGGTGPHLRVFSLGAIRGRLGFLSQQARSLVGSWSGPLDVKKVNLLLTVLAAGVGIASVGSFAMLSMRLSAPPSFSRKADDPAGGGALKTASALKSMAFYQEKVLARDIFRIGGQPVTQQAPQQENAAKQQMEEFLKRYKLVGISWSDNPDAMIENSDEQKTYFLKRGQMLGGMRIEAIFKDKVVVGYNGQEIELR